MGVQQTRINLGLRIKPQHHPQQHGRASFVVGSVVVLPILHHGHQFLLGMGDEPHRSIPASRSPQQESKAGIGIGNTPKNQSGDGGKHHSGPCRKGWVGAAPLRNWKTASHDNACKNPSVVAQVTTTGPLISVSPDVNIDGPRSPGLPFSERMVTTWAVPHWSDAHQHRFSTTDRCRHR